MPLQWVQWVPHVQDVTHTLTWGAYEYSVSTQYIKVLSVTDERAGALPFDMHRRSRQQVSVRRTPRARKIVAPAKARVDH